MTNPLLRIDAAITQYLKRLDTRNRAKQKYQRPNHDLFCACRNCVPSINTYARRLK
jgi:hypothetical protein